VTRIARTPALAADQPRKPARNRGPSAARLEPALACR